jgi:hypothetical protein
MSSLVRSPPWGVWCRCEPSRDPRALPARFPAGREDPMRIAPNVAATMRCRTSKDPMPSGHESLGPCSQQTSTVFPPHGFFADSDAPRGSPRQKMGCISPALMTSFAGDLGRANDADPITSAPPWPHSLISSALSCSRSNEPAPLVLSSTSPTSCRCLSANWSESCSRRPISRPGLFLTSH